MPLKKDLLQTIHPINPFREGSIFDHNGGTTYNPPPPHVDRFLLLEDGSFLLLESGDKIKLE